MPLRDLAQERIFLHGGRPRSRARMRRRHFATTPRAKTSVRVIHPTHGCTKEHTSNHGAPTFVVRRHGAAKQSGILIRDSELPAAEKTLQPKAGTGTHSVHPSVRGDFVPVAAPPLPYRNV